MSCYRPMKAGRSPSGEIFIGWLPGQARAMELPCGKCIGCKLDHANVWKVRIVHEGKLYRENVCVTLDYAPEALKSWSLEYADFQQFMRRLRKNLCGVTKVPEGGDRAPLRFFVAGEYGEQGGRPHFHAILFNTWFPDSVRYHNGTYRSKICEALWDRGNCVIDRLSSAAAAYVAGYTLKKAKQAAYEESLVDVRTGELLDRVPPFIRMSTHPGIGAWWYQRYGSDVFPGDFAVVDGVKCKVPRFYLERLRREGDAGVVESVLERRYERAMAHKEDGTPERLAVREELAKRTAAFYDSHTL